MKDMYKEKFVKISHKLDQTLADSYIARNPRNLTTRFDSIERELAEFITNPELTQGDKGRYIYHIEARVLESYLEAFHFRAVHGVDEHLPKEVIDATHHSMAEILDDFDGIYQNIAAQVALKRTEVEIPVLLLRTKKPEFFTWPTVFREDASLTRTFNHDSYQLYNGIKIRNQVKNTEYRPSGKRKKDDGYDEDTLMVIHQNVVNLDFSDGETHATVVEPRGIKTSKVDDEPYISYDEQPRFVAWGAGPKDQPEEDHATEYIQKIGGYKRDGLIDALVREARGEKLSIEELNLLNGASHYLMASVREKMQKVL